MMENKYVNDLINIADKIREKYELLENNSKEIERMTYLAQTSQKDSEEFKNLEKKHKHPNVVNFQDEVKLLCKVVKKIKK